MEMTYFRDELTCHWCGKPGTAWIASRLGDEGKTYRVGDDVSGDITEADFEDTSLVVRRPAAGEPIRVLLWWTCEHCGRMNFTIVTFAGGRVQAIEPVATLDPPTLDRIHYINELLREVVEEIIGESVYDADGLKPDWLDKLRAGLAAGRRWPSG